jgi:site-specific recombinase XerD
LAWRAASGRPPLERLEAGELHDYVRHAAGRLRIGAVRQTVSVLRTFCRFLFATGVTASDLSGCVPSVSGIRFDGLPKAVDGEVVWALLGSCVRSGATGRRDYAVLLLMVRLGLRAIEIARMELGDIDWRAGVIEVKGKGGRRDWLPLPADVGQALADYLSSGRRASSSRSVFLQAAGPPVGMSRNAVAFVSRTASERAGIPAVGGHRLRHTAATELLRHGASLREVGEVLRQSDQMTTSVYAKIDERSLRLAVRPWPAR